MRNEDLELDFLEQAEKMAQLVNEGFKEKVVHRLIMGDDLYGNRWASMTLPRLLKEICEEGLDLGSWTALTAQHPVLLAMDGAVLQRCHTLLAEIAAHGAKVDALVAQLREEML